MWCVCYIHNTWQWGWDNPKKKDEEPLIKPAMICEYSKFMEGVDKCDQYLIYYSTGQKSIKWWKRVFLRFFELAIVNVMVIYYHKNPGVAASRPNPFR